MIGHQTKSVMPFDGIECISKYWNFEYQTNLKKGSFKIFLALVIWIFT